ncbi:hypothetical protein scyTo_0005248 [Scyliorhinus torazame]|uniref:U6 snRNA-associated Sm-like protein LSm8 n=1 Tax=Scyliorhinus torazame TaxID=75743 RepID=A0A401P4M6_SCYTO|nr:hypothetical protein [Scyliorhinus torazame]
MGLWLGGSRPSKYPLVVRQYENMGGGCGVEDGGTVAVVTADGRMIVGTLKGFDQTINLILDESHERVFSSQQGVEQVVLGLYIVRGDNVAVIGEIDEETDSALDLGNIRAEPLNSVVH